MATILVVDDSQVIHHMLGYTLKRAGHTVIRATNGYEALDLLATTAVQLVIADLAMPAMDGFTLLRTIRTLASLHHIQVLILTASGQDDAQREAEQAGANGFLTKPASSHDLLATVNQLLVQARA